MSYPQSIETGDLAQWRSSHYLSYFGNHVIANGINLACQSLKLFIKLTQWLEKFLLPQTKLHFQWVGVLMDNLTPEIEPWWNGSVDSQRRCQPEMIQDGGRAGGSAVWLCCFPSMLNPLAGHNFKNPHLPFAKTILPTLSLDTVRLKWENMEVFISEQPEALY